MISLCFAPLLIAGWATSIETSWHHGVEASSPYVELQSCKDGVGAHIAVGTAPWATVGVHYGWTAALPYGWTATVQPRVGLSYSNRMHETYGRQVTRFEAGVEAIVCNGRWCGVVGYRHMSNGRGMTRENIGTDLFETGVGIQFH